MIDIQILKKITIDDVEKGKTRSNKGKKRGPYKKLEVKRSKSIFCTCRRRSSILKLARQEVIKVYLEVHGPCLKGGKKVCCKQKEPEQI